MIKALVFDCYGVLVTDSWLPFKNEQFGHNADLMEKAGYINKQSDMGNMSYDDFIQSLADLANMPSSQVMRSIESNAPNSQLFKYIRELKKSYKIGMLSNVGSDVLEDLFQNGELEVFDATALSYETGYVKPDSRAYKAAAERLGVELHECVMIDDIERNCTAAQEIGMQAVFYKDFDGFKNDLAKILANSKA